MTNLGSVRLVVVPSYDEQTDTWSVNAANAYTYTPFGGFYAGQCVENIDNPFKFTGQWHDAEIDQYYLRARMYDPAMMRFTGRDPVFGDHMESLTLHKYLYCLNNTINRVDSSGELSINIAAGLQAATTVYSIGLTFAAIGADIGDFELIVAGSYIQQLAGLAFAWGYATAGTGGNLMEVSRWGSQSEGAGWVMRGRASSINYALSGKWQPGWFPGGNQFAWPSSGHSWFVDPSKVSWPSGFFGFLEGLLGQRMYTP